MRDFLLLAGGAVYGALVVMVALAVARGLRVGKGVEPAPLPPAAVLPVERAAELVGDADVDVLEEQPVEVLSDAEVDARFRLIVWPEFTWEQWL